MKQNYSPYATFIVHSIRPATIGQVGAKKFPLLLRHVLKPLKTSCVILYKVNTESSFSRSEFLTP